MTGADGESGPTATWIAIGYFTFDPTKTLKIVHDVYFMDEAAAEQKVRNADPIG